MNACPVSEEAVVAPAAPARPAEAPAPTASRLRSSLAWNAASDATARGASLWLSFFVAHQLAVADFGRFSYVLSLVQVAWLAGDAVANSGYATRELARRRDEAGVPARGAGRVLWRSRLVAAALLTLAVLAAAAWLPIAPELRPVLAAGAAYFVAYAAFPDWALRALEDFRTLFLASAAYALVLVVTTALVLPRTHAPAHAALAWGAAFLAAAAVAVPALRARGVFARAPQVATWHQHARRSLVFALGAVAGIALAQLPLILSGALATPHEAGLFAAAFRMLVAVLGVFSVLWWPLFPVLVRLAPGSPEHRRTVTDAAVTVAALALPAASAATIFARPLLVELFGAPYSGGARALAMGAWVVPLFATCGLLEQVALAANGERLRLRVYGLAAAVQVALGVMFVARGGALAAAATLLAGSAVSAVMWAAAQRDVLPGRELVSRAWPVVAANAALAMAWLGLARVPGLPAVVAIGAGGVAYASGLVALRLVPWLQRAEREA